MRAIRCSVLLVLILVCMGTACAEQTGEAAPDTAHWYIQGGAYVHYDNRDDYQGPPIVGSIEYHKDNRWFGGFSAFNNSFGQFTQYLYLGKEFRPWDSHPHTRVKVSAGIVQGYRDEHYDTLPIRWGGSWGLGAVPSIGYQKGRFGYDAAILGVGGVLFLVGYSL